MKKGTFGLSQYPTLNSGSLVYSTTLLSYPWTQVNLCSPLPFSFQNIQNGSCFHLECWVWYSSSGTTPLLPLCDQDMVGTAVQAPPLSFLAPSITKTGDFASWEVLPKCIYAPGLLQPFQFLTARILPQHLNFTSIHVCQHLSILQHFGGIDITSNKTILYQ